MCRSLAQSGSFQAERTIEWTAAPGKLGIFFFPLPDFNNVFPSGGFAVIEDTLYFVYFFVHREDTLSRERHDKWENKQKIRRKKWKIMNQEK